MLNFITQHPVISVIAFIVLADLVYSTIRLLLVFVCSLISSKEGDFKRNIRAQLDRLESRIAKIEKVEPEEEGRYRYGVFIRELAKKIKQDEHRMRRCFSRNKPYYLCMTPFACGGKERDCLFVAKEALKLAGYDPDSYNFDVEFNKSSACFIVTVSVKED